LGNSGNFTMSGSNNIFSGNNSGLNNTTGSNNSFSGYRSGYSNTTGSNNVVLGSYVNAPSATASGQLNIGNVLYGTDLYSTASQSSTPVAGGKIGIGVTTPTVALDVAGNAKFSAVTSGTNANDIGITSDGTLTTAASDRRLKENIQVINSEETLNKILQLKPSSFDWKSNSTHDIGLIAQEVEEIFPELVFTNSVDGFKGINYSRLPALLISATQELYSKIDWIGDYITRTADGIVGRFKKVQTEEFCVDEDTCLDKDSLIRLIKDYQGYNSDQPSDSVELSGGVSSDESPVPDETVEEAITDTDTT